ncbi:right-handed parallel beta-helix repeat-containing protein [bacterium]|nr:right-handed parallel beta-helix repeat-containing protein [bacterium]
MKKLVMLLTIILTVSLRAGTFSVDNTQDDENIPNTLRWAIKQCNLNVGPDTIIFAISDTFPLFSSLELTDNGTVIIGTVSGALKPEVSIVNDFAVAQGIVVRGSNCVLAYLNIRGFSSTGVFIEGSRKDKIIGCYIGTSLDGLSANSITANGMGIFIYGGGAGNIVIGDPFNANGRNIISGNLSSGIVINNNVDSCLIVGNYIGLNATGTLALPNGGGGIELLAGTNNNVIGWTTPAGRNVISGNSGTAINNSGTNLSVLNNIIGLNANGTAMVPNIGGHGVYSGGKNTIIGLPGAGNIIAGNNASGIYLDASDSAIVQGNFIGTDITGSINFGNSNSGVRMLLSKFCLIGGTTPGSRNVISGNHDGIVIQSGTHNKISGNYIGLKADGLASLGNSFYGILLSSNGIDSVCFNTIGDTVPEGRNVISGNAVNGISLYNRSVTHNAILGNYIGTDANGTAAIPNNQPGIILQRGPKHNKIGNGLASGRNIISGNTVVHGIWIVQSDSNMVSGNFIGTNPTGTTALRNNIGIVIDSSKAIAVSKNLISGNTQEGLLLENGALVRVEDNIIGADATGNLPIPNGSGVRSGIFISKRSRIDSAISNRIAFNDGYGILVDGPATDSSIFYQNAIFKNSLGGTVFQNGAQKNIAPPRITNVTVDGTVSGYSAPNAFVQIYADSVPSNQGRFLLGTTVADDAGNWTKQVNFSAGNVLTALQDSAQNTSAFSTPVGFISLTGSLSILPSSTIDFGNVEIGSSTSQTVRLASQSDNIRLNSTASALSDPFQMQPLLILPDTLKLGVDTISLTFDFEPNITGQFKDTLVLLTSSGEFSIILQGQGIEVDHQVPTLSIKLLRSTVAQDYVDIITSSDEDLSELTGRLALDNTIDVIPSHIGTSNQLFSTTYRLAEGILTITMIGKDLAGNSATQTRTYTVSAFSKNYFSMKYSTIELSATHSIPQTGFVMLAAVPANKGLSKTNATSEWTQIGNKFQFFTTADFSEGQFMNLRSYYDQNEVAKLKANYTDFDERKIGLYHYSEENSSWMYLGGEGYQMQVNAKITKVGEIAAFYNPDHVVLPKSLELSQNYPNPFNPTTAIRFGLPEEGRVVLTVYNILGQKIKELVNEARSAGYHQVDWNGKNESGVQVASGVYIYRLETISGVKMKKMLLIK